MQILIVGIGALGGTIAARALRAGLPVRLAARDTESRRCCADRACECPASEERWSRHYHVAALEDYGRKPNLT